MSSGESLDWANGTPGDQKRMAQRANPEQLRAIARTYDWRLYPEEVLGWVMAQKSVDLGTALSAFLNGEPERFNYMPKRDVPEQHRATARVLDNICLRVNSGFYLASDGQDVSNARRLERWLEYQEIDRAEGRRGRWILDEGIVASLHDKPELPCTVAVQSGPAHSLWRDVLSPVMELGVNREHLKYLPDDG